MLDKIINQVEIEFFELVGIGVKDDKFVRLDTNEEYVFSGMNDNLEFEFKCNDSIITVYAIENKDGNYSPCYVGLEENGLKYMAWDYNGRELSINKIGEYGNTVSIYPEKNTYFIKTKFDYIIPGQSFTETARIDCSYSSIKLYPNIRYRYDGFDFETYDYLFQNHLVDLYPDEISEAFIKCKQFIYKGFEEYISYPVDNYDEFATYYRDELIRNRLSFADAASDAYETKEYYIDEGKHRLEKGKKRDDYSEEASIYFEAVSKLDKLITEAFKRMKDEEKKIESEQEDFQKYVAEYNEKGNYFVLCKKQ